MKLEQKHIKGYLGTGLKAINIQNNKEFELELHFLDYCMRNIEIYKLLLRPLSQLTKEIEHNGKKFVPLEVIARMIEHKDTLIDKSSFDFNVINENVGYDLVFQLRYKTDYDNYKKVVMLNFHQQEKCFWHTEKIIPISCIENLLEWQFDIFGLIENNLAEPIKN